ncbi:hypothetical protein [Ensifer sp. ENS07]|uniref:hypothetical protein n=1 Tax=Ensifer sp. ENS07 TaxID=2769274 RepID=UPI001FEE4476|nr:hypothetical protein [Ensifer sp. ENS07]
MEGGAVAISPAQLSYLLSGIDWRNPQETWHRAMSSFSTMSAFINANGPRNCSNRRAHGLCALETCARATVPK